MDAQSHGTMLAKIVFIIFVIGSQARLSAGLPKAEKFFGSSAFLLKG